MIKKRPIFFLLLFSPAIAIANPPYLTDDPIPTEYKHFEIYVDEDLDQTNAANTFNLPYLEIDYGWLPNVELTVVPVAIANISRNSTTKSSYGIGDTQIGATWLLIPESARIPAVSFNPAISLPTGDETRQLGNGRNWEVFPLWAEKNWDKWTVDTGGGFTLNSAPDGFNYFFGGFLLQREITDNLVIGGEVFRQGATDTEDSATTLVNFGAVYTLSKRFELLFSAGHSIEGQNHLISTFGLHCIL